jgi:nitrate/TMAO reductase-like tetraheme cytochrome c subunit
VQAAAQTNVWSWNAAIACQNCHDHEKVTAVYLKSVHGQQELKGNLETATCASCHGSHNIYSVKTAIGKAQMHASADIVCGKPGCHAAQYLTYDDYYHGAAYKKGEADSPSCWQCHGAHDIQPVKNPDSKLSTENIGKTCGKCHKGSDAEFGQQAALLIHQKKTIYNDNLIVKAISWVQSFFPGGSAASAVSTVTAPVEIDTGGETSPTAPPVAN